MNWERIIKWSFLIFILITAIELAIPFYNSFFLDIIYVIRSYFAEGLLIYLCYELFKNNKFIKLLLYITSLYYIQQMFTEICYYIPQLNSIYNYMGNDIGYLIVFVFSIISFYLYYKFYKKRKIIRNGRMVKKAL